MTRDARKVVRLKMIAVNRVHDGMLCPPSPRKYPGVRFALVTVQSTCAEMQRFEPFVDRMVARTMVPTTEVVVVRLKCLKISANGSTETPLTPAPSRPGLAQGTRKLTIAKVFKQKTRTC